MSHRFKDDVVDNTLTSPREIQARRAASSPGALSTSTSQSTLRPGKSGFFTTLRASTGQRASMNVMERAKDVRKELQGMKTSSSLSIGSDSGVSDVRNHPLDNGCRGCLLQENLWNQTDIF